MVPIPSNAGEITAEWLSNALTPSGGTGHAAIGSIEIERIAEGVGIVADLHRLTLSGARESGMEPRTLVVKMPSALAEVRELARSYGLYQREVVFYREVASTISLRTPYRFFADFDPASQNFIIVMEDLAPAKSVDQLAGMALDEVRLAIESVADLHARWWDRPELESLEAIIQPWGCPPYAGIDARYQAAWAVAEPWLARRISSESRRVAERLGTRLDQLATELAIQPRTICHGDFRADNLMFNREAGALSMAAVDWQVAAQSRGTFDIGYLMGGSVTSELRREHEMTLLSLYHRRLIEQGVAGYDFDLCLHDYRRAVLVGFSYWVQAAAAADLSQPRTEALFDAWAHRLDAATLELGLAEFVA
jgi:thiamine kinase-like enzyme